MGQSQGRPVGSGAFVSRKLPPPSAVVDARGRLACRYCSDRLEISGEPCHAESWQYESAPCDFCERLISEIARQDLHTYHTADGDHPRYDI